MTTHPLTQTLLDQISAWSRDRIEGDRAGMTTTELCRYTNNMPTNRCMDLYVAYQAWDEAGRPLTEEDET